MALNQRKLLTLLEIEDRALNELRSRMRNSLKRGKDLESLLSRQCENQQETGGCFSCDLEGNCAVLRGVLRASLNDLEGGLKEIGLGNERFRSIGQIWNHIVGLALFGLVWELQGKKHKAALEYGKALNLLDGVYLVIHSTDYRKRRKALALKAAISAQERALSG